MQTATLINIQKMLKWRFLKTYYEENINCVIIMI